MLDTYETLIDWIGENVPTKELGTPTVLEAAIWFACVQEADHIHECYTAKNLASLVENGMQPLNTPERVAEWLQEQYDVGDGDEDYEKEITKNLENSLRRHFGL